MPGAVHVGGPCDVEIVPDCDHFYVGREQAVSEIVVRWLKRTLAL
jgi:alpha/beta superfamily hydrolase